MQGGPFQKCMHCSCLGEVWQIEGQGASPRSLRVPRVPEHMRVKFIFSLSLDQRMAQTGMNLLQDSRQQLVRVRARIEMLRRSCLYRMSREGRDLVCAARLVAVARVCSISGAAKSWGRW